MTRLEFSGFGSISNLTNLVKKHNAKNIFLVTGKKSYEISGAKEKIETLFTNISITRFYDFPNNPQKEDVERGILKLKSKQHDIIVAVGGGSALDMAKAINFFSSTSLSIEESIEKNFSHKIGSLLPFITVPTTVGSGSEATQFSVMYYKKTKYSITNPILIPDYVILDPQFAINLPTPVLASTGIDALAQSIEAFWSVNSNEESLDYSRKSLSIILDHIEKAVIQKSEESVYNMLIGSNLAGKAINIAKTTAPHAFSYAMTINHNIAHGQAVGITLGEFYLFNSNSTQESLADMRGMSYLRNIFSEMNSILKVSNSNEACEKLKSILLKIGLKTRLSELGIKDKDDLEKLIKSVNKERLKNNPRRITESDLYKLVNKIK
jgi:alcohol dehydrogenase